MKTRKRKTKQNPSPAQLRARARFVKMVRARAKAAKKTKKANPRGKSLRVTRVKRTVRSRRNPGLTSSVKTILREYVKDRTPWSYVQKRLIEEGFTDKQLRAAEEFYAVESARLPGGSSSRPSSPRPSSGGSVIDAIIEGIKRADSAATSGALVDFRSIRRALKNRFSTKAAFDKAVLQAAEAGAIVLHRHVFPQSLTQAERDELVTDGRNYYVGAAFRNPARRRNKTIIKAKRVKIAVANKTRRLRNAVALPATSSSLRQQYDPVGLRKLRDRLRSNIQNYTALTRNLAKQLKGEKRDSARAQDLRKQLAEIERLESREVDQLDQVLRKLSGATTIRRPKRNPPADHVLQRLQSHLPEVRKSLQDAQKLYRRSRKLKDAESRRRAEMRLFYAKQAVKDTMDAIKRRRAEVKGDPWFGGRTKRRQPNPGVTAKSRATRKLFTGMKSKKTLSLVAPTGTRKSVAILGKLVKIKTRSRTFTPPKRNGRNPEGEIYLAADDSGQLVIVGENLPVVPGPARDLGEIIELDYATRKPHLGYDQTTEFFHELGEEGGRRPHLVTDSEGHLKIAGGDYYIEKDGIHD